VSRWRRRLPPARVAGYSSNIVIRAEDWRMRRLPIVFVLLLLAGAAPAKLYKWVDEQGNVTYSERKPPDKAAEEIKLIGVPAVTREQARERLDELGGKAETAAKDREFKKTATAEAAEREARMKKNCETAQQNLRVLQTASRVKSEDGQFMNDEQRAARLKATQKEIADNCN
jgi:hypothetical protein